MDFNFHATINTIGGEVILQTSVTNHDVQGEIRINIIARKKLRIACRVQNTLLWSFRVIEITTEVIGAENYGSTMLNKAQAHRKINLTESNSRCKINIILSLHKITKIQNEWRSKQFW